MVTSQEVCSGQSVCVARPSTWARMSPFVLKKWRPVTTTTVPAPPRSGVTDTSTGAPGAAPGIDVVEVEVVEVVEVLVDVEVGGAEVSGGALRALGARVVGAAARCDRLAGGLEEWPLELKARSRPTERTAASTTAVATRPRSRGGTDVRARFLQSGRAL
jgi:hypothetical protein